MLYDEAKKLGPLKAPSAPKVRTPIYLEQEAEKLGPVKDLEQEAEKLGPVKEVER